VQTALPEPGRARGLPGASPHITDGDDRARQWAAIRAESAQLLKLRAGFDPGEPRDEHGQWTGGGGGSDGDGGSEAAAADDGAASAGEPASGRPEVGGGRYAGYAGAFSGKGPGNAEGSGDVKTVWSLHGPARADWQATGRTPVTFHELKPTQGAGRFEDAIKAAQAANPYGASVEAHSGAEYAFMRPFLTSDGKAGFALADDNIVSVFKHPGAQLTGFAQSALALATQNGGRRLDAFDTVLPKLYSRSGFRAVARLPFNPKFAPAGWNAETFKEFNNGKPDVVFMVYDPAHAQEYKRGDGKPVATYEEGIAAQTAALKALDDTHAAAAEPKPVAPTTAMTQMEMFPGLFPELPPVKTPIEMADFSKGKVEVDSDTTSDPEKSKKFLEEWDAHVAEAPEQFKKDFMGNVPCTMRVNFNYDSEHAEPYENNISINGKILDKENGNSIGTYTRTIDFLNNKASSDYFALNHGHTGGDIGKQVLKANVDMYQKLGLDEVEVHADIDVGGYAWAKYGYVPTDDSWSSLSSDIRDKIGGGGGYEPSSWDELTSDQQDNVRDAWKRDTRDEFEQSEADNWRDNGGDLHQAKENLTQALADANEPPKWMSAALDKLRAGRADAIPFSDQQIHDALSVGDYSDRYDDGRADPDITIDETALPEADRDKLTDDMRHDIEGALVDAFNDQAERDRSDVDPPDFSDSVDDFQNESWDAMSDRDKFRWASNNGELPNVETDSGDIDEDEASVLRDLADSGDPKAIWSIADSAHGKDLLLGTDWNGVIDLHDRETMDRFNAYVGKAKK
jgi:hypothetical protein